MSRASSTPLPAFLTHPTTDTVTYLIIMTYNDPLRGYCLLGALGDCKTYHFSYHHLYSCISDFMVNVLVENGIHNNQRMEPELSTFLTDTDICTVLRK